MSIFVDIIYLIIAIFYLPSFILKGKYRAGFRERFGFLNPSVIAKIKDAEINRPIIWVHAVSVGEIKAAAVLIDKLRQEFKAYTLLISTITSTGNKVAQQMAAKEDIVIYFPFDLSFIVRRFLNLIKPKALLVMETELWPNMIKLCVKKEIPVVIINGRISDKAYPNYERAKFLFGPIVNKVSLFCMQTQTDNERIVSLGADPKKVRVIGNLKFDQVKPPEDKIIPKIGLLAKDLAKKRLIVAGSTHYPEEEIIIRVFLRIKKLYPDIRLLLAPRHVHRVESIEKILKEENLSYCLISKLKGVSQEEVVFILDIMGVLDQFYKLADIVFVGGSLIRHGGQNPIEPAIFAKPIIFGQHMFNFSKIAQMFLDNNAAICVNNEENFYKVLLELFQNPEKIKILSSRAEALVCNNQGAAQRAVDLLKVNRIIT